MELLCTPEAKYTCVFWRLGPAIARCDKTAPAAPEPADLIKTDRMSFDEALTMTRLTGIVREFGKQYELRRGTMRLTSQLRFTFERDPWLVLAADRRLRRGVAVL